MFRRKGKVKRERVRKKVLRSRLAAEIERRKYWHRAAHRLEENLLAATADIVRAHDLLRSWSQIDPYTAERFQISELLEKK